MVKKMVINFFDYQLTEIISFFFVVKFQFLKLMKPKSLIVEISSYKRVVMVKNFIIFMLSAIRISLLIISTKKKRKKKLSECK